MSKSIAATAAIAVVLFNWSPGETGRGHWGPDL